MALDYVLKFPCEVRKNVPEAKLVTLVGHMSLAEFAVAEIRKSNPAVPMETILGKYEVSVSQTRPDGAVEQTPMTIGQLVALAQPISQYSGHCAQCPANIADRPFGCIAKINYPIPKGVRRMAPVSATRRHERSESLAVIPVSVSPYSPGH